MRCYDCSTQYVERTGDIVTKNHFIGNFTTKDVTYYVCPACSKRLFPMETSIKISEREKEIKSRMIEKLPIGEFILPSEAADILGITRQALHKNRKIKKGLIYQTEKAGKRLYHRKSVEMFKREGDGRFDLVAAVTEVTVTDVKTIVLIVDKRVEEKFSFDFEPQFNWYEKEQIKETPILQ